MPHLFVYGTLRDPQTLEHLTKRSFASLPATLPDFGKVEPDGSYPYLRAAAGAQVEGLVWLDVDAASLRELDRYEAEGELYVRTAVQVRTAQGVLAAQTYVGITARHPVRRQ